jgi:predicted ATPase/class 3 adenylate cyclase
MSFPVAFFFSDIEGSTKLWENFPDQMTGNLEVHDTIMHRVISQHAGQVFKTVGDAFCAAFTNPIDAINAAMDAQRALEDTRWGEAVIRVRIGLHSGEAQKRDSDYFGPTLNRVARLMSVGHGGQILLSEATVRQVRDQLPAGVSLIDFGEKRLRDLIRPEKIYQLNAPGLAKTFPPLRTLEVFQTNLPTPISTFIGREKEIAEVKKAIQSYRLVTITGTGGTGKTRLSLQVAADLLDQYPDGVWFVELAPISDPERVPHAIFSVLKLTEQKGKTTLETLTSYLRDKRTLIILDNCEHVIDECSMVASALLAEASKLNILASSREAFIVTGEQTYRLPSLSLPDPKSNPVVEALSNYEAVRLFVERANLVASNFKINESNAGTITRICQRLDGIPLAIELAAARIRMMAPEQIADRLDNVFKLLTGGGRTVLPRQQTLQASIDWSYDLLSKSERLLLQRLAVFSGGWTLEAAETICASPSENHIFPEDIVDLLGRLVDKSMIIFSDESRYQFLEIMRQYIREKLSQSGESQLAFQRHSDYFAGFLNKNQHNFSVLDGEWPNILVAFEFLSDQSRSDDLLEFTRSISDVLFERGHLDDGHKIFEKALDFASRHTDIGQLALFEYYSGRMFFQSDSFDRSIQLLTDSLKHNHSNDQLKADTLYFLAFDYFRKSDIEVARKTIRAARKVYKTLHNEVGFAMAMTLEGEYGLYDENLEPIRRMLLRALKIQRQKKDLFGCVRSLVSLARTELEKKSRSDNAQFVATAELYALEALQISENINDWYERPYILDTLALIYFHRQEWEKSRQYALAGLKEFINSKPSQDRAQILIRLCWIEDELGDFTEALNYAQQSLLMCEVLKDIRGIAYVLFDIGKIFAKTGNLAAAKENLSRSELMLRDLDDKVMLDYVKKALEGLTS